MTTKKRVKAKTKAKTKKKSVKARAAPARKKRPAAKAKPKARAARPTAAVRAGPAPMPRPTTPPPVAIAGEERVGIVIHYFSHLSVAIIRMERGSLREGDTVHIQGHTSDFRQRVESMEIDHVHVMQVGAKQEFGMRVVEHAREHDVVYKVAS